MMIASKCLLGGAIDLLFCRRLPGLKGCYEPGLDGGRYSAAYRPAPSDGSFKKLWEVVTSSKPSLR